MNRAEYDRIFAMGEEQYRKMRRMDNTFLHEGDGGAKRAVYLAGYYKAESHSQTDLKPEEFARLLALAKFREFNQTDWMGFAGCETQNPMIAETQYLGDNYTIVMDGSTFNVIKEGDPYGGQVFEINDSSPG